MKVLGEYGRFYICLKSLHNMAVYIFDLVELLLKGLVFK